MKAVAVLICPIVLVACGISPAQKELPLLGLGYSPLVDGASGQEGDVRKDQIARSFIEALSRETPPLRVSSVAVRNPSAWDFSQIVETFSQRAAVPFTREDADLAIQFELLPTGGPQAGGGIRYYVLFLSVIRPRVMSSGDQVVAMREERFTCRVDGISSAAQSCGVRTPAVAEELLYRLAADFRTP